MKKNNGYTVIEVLISLSVLAAILIMIVGMGRSAIQRASISSIANGFIADFSFAKQLATRENRYIAIEFNAFGTGYSIKRQVEIGNLTNTKTTGSGPNWFTVRTATPLTENKKERSFFEYTGIHHLAVNSVGEVYEYDPTAGDGSPRITNMQPVDRVIDFFIKMSNQETHKDYEKTMRIYPSGGIKVEE
ncbi:MAG: hypothetical protein GY757_62520 [bacterium]|nr:hypothetical protein [bacterium]